MASLIQRHLRPTPTDGYPTDTSALQTSTEEILQKHIAPLTSPSETTKGGPILQRRLHLDFLLRNLRQGFPQRYTGQDASQSWLIFWTLQGFSVLGVGLDDLTKKRARETLLAMQHPDGGFSGGPGQIAHLLPTYAAVCSLAIVGQPGEGGAWDAIDRQKLYKFFMSLKLSDGSFLVSHGGEVDVRGVYCLLAVATLLNIMTPELLDGTPEFIASCQTYEGGFGNASFPGWAFQEDGPNVAFESSAPRPVLGEAHGGYTFCATASWVLLQPYLRQYYPRQPTKYSQPILPPTINTHALVRWLANMQGSEIELGGFKGRTNKLVDGCYSWWVGGCFGLLDGLLGVSSTPSIVGAADVSEKENIIDTDKEVDKPSGDDAWHDIDDALFNREALQEYILWAGQHPAGGLRDKPPKSADAYHTLYCLSGLSSAQHHVAPDESRKVQLSGSWRVDGAKEKDVNQVDRDSDSDVRLYSFKKDVFSSALCWLEDEGADIYVGGSGNRVNATQPLFNLTVTHTELMMAYFYGQTLPQRRAKTVGKKR